jgi:hypothetical protein
MCGRVHVVDSSPWLWCGGLFCPCPGPQAEPAISWIEVLLLHYSCHSRGAAEATAAWPGLGLKHVLHVV